MVVAFRVTDGNSGWFSYLAARERPLMPRDGSCTQTDLHTLQSALIFLGFRISENHVYIRAMIRGYIKS